MADAPDRMREVEIRLRQLPASENPGSAEEYFKVIQDAYAAQYLSSLGVAPTPANLHAVIRERPLDDCDIHAVWAETEGKRGKTADVIRITKPLHKRSADFQGGDLDHMRRWYGEAYEIGVKQPDVKGAAHADDAALRPRREDDGASLHGSQFAGERAPTVDASQELANELAAIRVRAFARGYKEARRAPTADSAAGSIASLSVDEDPRPRRKEELAALKAKFIMPFACEVRDEDGRTSLRTWPAEGAFDLPVPEALRAEVGRPITLSIEDIRRNTSKWVSDDLPLELLTSKAEDGLLAEVRRHLLQTEVFQLVGLLSHLLYWSMLGMNRRGNQKHIADEALSAMFLRVHEVFSPLEGQHRESSLGVSLVLPLLVLTLKRGIERTFEVQYKTLMTSPALGHVRSQVIVHINALVMRLFDPDCMYARFGKLDGTGKAIALWRQLDLLASAAGLNRAKRLYKRTHHATPLVRAVLLNAGSPGAEEGSAWAHQMPSSGLSPSSLGAGFGSHGDGDSRVICDARTRAMLLQGERGGARGCGSGAPAGVPRPPADAGGRRTLLKAAMMRLAMPVQEQRAAEGPDASSASHGRPRARREPAASMPLSARSGSQQSYPGGLAPQGPVSARGLRAS